MISEFRLSGFRCFSKLAVPMRPLTVLVGKNDSGKSTFLQALRAFGSSGPQPSDRARHDIGTQVDLEGTVSADGSSAASTRLAWSLRSVSDNITRTKGDWTGVVPSAYFDLRADSIGANSQGASDAGGAPQLGSQGENLPTLLDFMYRRERGLFFKLEARMKALVPGLEAIEIAVPDASQRRVDFVIESGMRLPASEVSSGVRLMLFFLALVYHPTPPKLVLIEEPENGVHPRRLRDVMVALREMTEGRDGRPSVQVVLSTHSPYLLDEVDVNRDQVLVFERGADGIRQAKPVDSEGLKSFLSEFMLGEIWFNQGEDALVAQPT